MLIGIPKGFFEDKNSVTPGELLEMVTEFVNKTRKLEEDLNYELETDSRFMLENITLKKRIEELETEFKRLGLDGAL